MNSSNERTESWKCQECRTPLLPKLCDSCSGRGRVGLLTRGDCGVCDGDGFTWRCPHTGSHRFLIREKVQARRAEGGVTSAWELWPRAYDIEPATS